MIRPRHRIAAFAALLPLVIGACSASDGELEPEFLIEPTWGTAFEDEGVTGTFALQRVDSDDPPLIYDVKNVRRDVAPGEVFKLFATLVALDADILDSLDTELEWGGEGPEVPPWNRTHSLRSALEGEGEWFYGQIVDLVGEDPFEVWLNRAGYGNANLRGTVRTEFWSDGTLTIDALQMVDFYADLFSDQPTFDRYAAFDVKDLMRVEEGDGWRLTWYSGTDYATQSGPIGWLVGAVVTDEETWALAMNVDLPENPGLDLDLRTRITLAVLEAQGLIDS